MGHNNYKLKYGDKTFCMEGIVKGVSRGVVSIDFKANMGHIDVPKKLIISDPEPSIGDEVGFNMSFLEKIDKE